MATATVRSLAHGKIVVVSVACLQHQTIAGTVTGRLTDEEKMKTCHHGSGINSDINGEDDRTWNTIDPGYGLTCRHPKDKTSADGDANR